MRLFLSLELSSETVRKIKKWRKPLEEKYPALSWTSEAQLHITLRFLGNRTPEQVKEEMNSLQLPGFLPVEYALNRTGKFGEPPSVLWLSGEFSPQVFSLARSLGSIPDERGETSQAEHFTPHITLARIKREVKSPNIRFNGRIDGTGSAVHLVRSRLDCVGASYETLYSIFS